MELNNNLIGVQSVLANCVKHTGEFTKINYSSGNERHLLHVTTELALFLNKKHLLEENKVLPENLKALNEIIFFLAINTEFERPLSNMEDYAHLIDIIPRLSKCVFANICFGLDLVESYGYVIEKFPLEITEEFLDAAIDCLRKGKQEDQFNNEFIILRAVVSKLRQIELSYKTEDTVADIVKVSTIIIRNLTSYTRDQAKSMKISKVYRDMGFSLLKLLDFLLYMDENNKVLQILLASIVSIACDIIKSVTLEVFCSWVEVEYESEPLQAVIAHKAYLVKEKYQGNKIASELTGMLCSIARKPKPIAEQILDANIPTMIKMVDQNDEYQKLWFRALLNTPVFLNKLSLACIERWWNICDESCLNSLLKYPLPGEPEKRQLIIKCTSNLNSEDLSRYLYMHFNREHFKWKEIIDNQLILIFNKSQQNISEEDLKQILLLILQNAKAFFKHFYETAFKRSSELIKVFDLIKHIAEVNNIGLEVLMEVLNENVPSSDNLNNYIQLFDTMIKSHYYTYELLVTNVILTLIEKFKNEGCLEELNCCLRILKHFQHLKCPLSKEIELFEYFLTCQAEYRCKSFLEFELIREEITHHCVEYLLHKCLAFRELEGKRESFSHIGANLNDPWSNYYKNLFLSQENISFLDWVLPNLDFSNYQENRVDENFTKLLKVLPQCVPSEWMVLLKETTAKHNLTVTLNVLSEIMILLCDFGANQLKSPQSANLAGLKFSLQNYGAFLMSSDSREDQLLAINSLCRVLKHIPGPLKETEGMSLINALPEDALKSLAGDKEFVARIVLINDKQLCKALAQKILASK
ncbi:unnamed protein product [Ceutorhynchus assimilis]|uniref:Uncharacterized protein n=1 Tax=Ceutorhynchus assimilis TaxID=467358 RepID=A0A9N9QIX0_9CUCU|nr:unnamed protein product [Ceutorhynchus assimilis]